MTLLSLNCNKSLKRLSGWITSDRERETRGEREERHRDRQRRRKRKVKRRRRTGGESERERGERMHVVADWRYFSVCALYL